MNQSENFFKDQVIRLRQGDQILESKGYMSPYRLSSTYKKQFNSMVEDRKNYISHDVYVSLSRIGNIN